MARFRLEPPPGLNTDDTTYAARGAYRDADKVRFREGRGQTIGGWEALTTTLLTGVCRNVLQWTGLAGSLLVAFGTHSNLQVYSGGGLYDITPTGLAAGQIDGTGGAGYGTGTYGTGAYSQPSTADYFPRTWSLSPYGAELIATPRGQTIYWWQGDPATAAAALTNAPANVTCSLVTTKRQVMAFGCTDTTGTFDPLMIRWSDINGGITTWTPATSNNAGFVRLEGAGRIVGAMMCGDNVLCWTNAALYLGTYTGNPGSLWTFERQGEHGGLIGPNAAAVQSQAAFWLSPSGQFYSYVLGSQPEVLPCPIRDEFVANIASVQQDKIAASTVSKFGEIWWFYPDGRDGLENSRAIFVNITEPNPETGGLAWSKAVLARTAFTDGDPSPFPIGADPAGAAYYHEKANSANGAALGSLIETADQYLDDSQGLTMVRGFWPDFQDLVGAVTVYIVTRLFPQAPETVHGPFTFNASTQKVDLRITARLARVRIVSSASPSAWRLGSTSFDLTLTGSR